MCIRQCCECIFQSKRAKWTVKVHELLWVHSDNRNFVTCQTNAASCPLVHIWHAPFRTVALTRLHETSCRFTNRFYTSCLFTFTPSNRCSIAFIVTGRSRNLGWIIDRGWRRFFLHSKLTGAGTHSAPCPKDIEGFSPGAEIPVTWKWPRPSMWLRMSGVITPGLVRLNVIVPC
jgi:hypothetical protein